MATGRKTGGRKAGTPNVSTLTLREQVEHAAGGPLPVLLATVGAKAMKEGDHQLAVTAFAKAMAFVYPRIPPTDQGTSSPVPSFQIVAPDGSTMPQIHITREVIRGACSKCGHKEKDASTPTP